MRFWTVLSIAMGSGLGGCSGCQGDDEGVASCGDGALAHGEMCDGGYITFTTNNLLNYGLTNGLVTVQPVP